MPGRAGTYQPNPTGGPGGSVIYKCKVCNRDFRSWYSKPRVTCGKKCWAKWIKKTARERAADPNRGPMLSAFMSMEAKRRWAEGVYDKAAASRPNPWLNEKFRNAKRHPSLEERKARRLKEVLNFMAKPPATITPRRLNAMREKVSKCVGEQLEDAHLVVKGEKQWSATQARVFKTLLDKVLPNLEQRHIQEEDPSRPLNEYTQEELEAIIAAAEKASHDLAEEESE